MAIKSSNQITFTEHKKIVAIKEYYLATAVSSGVTTATAGWTQDIQTIDYDKKFLWNYEEVVYSIGDPEISEPIIIGFYGQGKGISNIINSYVLTTIPELPASPEWSTDASVTTGLTPTNKYLWNKETIEYTDGTSTDTDPAIIGVYGDSGAGIITFEIYSTQGFQFKESLQEIKLQVAAFDGTDSITDATYSWYWWDKTLNNNKGAYSEIITDQTDATLTVNAKDPYALESLKCVMTYQDKTYEDYVTLTNETVVYTTVVKFFDGSNIFHADDLYIIAYVEVYQNNQRVESIFDVADVYCSGLCTVDWNTFEVTTDLQGTFQEGDKMFFVFKQTNTKYQTFLGEYQSGKWKKISYSTKYKYSNSSHVNERAPNLLAISKEQINKAQNIEFIVSDKYGVELSRTNVNVIDSNDPIISTKAPSNPVNNQLWLDTSVAPYVLKMYNSAENQWLECAEKIGGSVFTSQPTSGYTAGDLWILADGEVCGSFGPGSMLKATTTSKTFNTSHWVDADSDMTALKQNIKQYFTFDSTTGLKIGQVDEKFYVNISSTEMGFYDNQQGQHQRVVKISNNSAVIQSAKLKGATDFYGPMNICDPASDPEDAQVDTLFMWQIESNGSLSLAVPT